MMLERSRGGGPLVVDYGLLGGVERDLAEVSDDLRGGGAVLGVAYDECLAGAGQFAGVVRSGVTGFVLAWRETFEVCADSAAVVGNNVGRFVVDVRATDMANPYVVRL